MLFVASPCCVEDCKNEGTYMITIMAKNIQKGFGAPKMKGYMICEEHMIWFCKLKQLIIKDY